MHIHHTSIDNQRFVIEAGSDGGSDEKVFSTEPDQVSIELGISMAGIETGNDANLEGEPKRQKLMTPAEMEVALAPLRNPADEVEFFSDHMVVGGDSKAHEVFAKRKCATPLDTKSPRQQKICFPTGGSSSSSSANTAALPSSSAASSAGGDAPEKRHRGRQSVFSPHQRAWIIARARILDSSAFQNGKGAPPFVCKTIIDIGMDKSNKIFEVEPKQDQVYWVCKKHGEWLTSQAGKAAAKIAAKKKSTSEPSDAQKRIQASRDRVATRHATSTEAEVKAAALASFPADGSK